MPLTEDDATTLATALALCNALKVAINDHITRGDGVTAIPLLSLSE